MHAMKKQSTCSQSETMCISSDRSVCFAQTSFIDKVSKPTVLVTVMPESLLLLWCSLAVNNLPSKMFQSNICGDSHAPGSLELVWFRSNPRLTSPSRNPTSRVPNICRAIPGTPEQLPAGWNLGFVLNPKRLDFGWLLAPAAAGGKASMTARPNTNDLRFNDMRMMPYIELLACSGGEGLRHLELPSLKSPSYHRRHLGV